MSELIKEKKAVPLLTCFCSQQDLEPAMKIHATATEGFFDDLQKTAMTIEKALELRQAASDAHNHEETLLLAKSIEKMELTGSYGI
jgi:hypothetical protein